MEDKHGLNIVGANIKKMGSDELFIQVYKVSVFSYLFEVLLSLECL